MGHMHDRKLIRSLYAAGLDITSIARRVGCSRGTVYRAIAPGAATSYRRQARYAEAIERVRRLVSAYPLMEGPALAHQADWPGSLRHLQHVVHPMRFPAMEAAAARGVLIRPLPKTKPR